MARFLWWVVALPLGMVVVALSVANRHSISIALDPLASDPFAASGTLLSPVTLPGFVVVLGSVLTGVIAGGIAVWLSQGRHRREKRRLRDEVRRLERDIEALNRQAAESLVARPALPRSKHAA